MDKAYLNALNKRKSELQKELSSIENILQLYPDEPQPVSKSESNVVDLKTNNSINSLTVKDTVLEVIKNLGGQAYVSQLVIELKKHYPDKNNKSINNIARNYVYILKNEGRLKSEKKEDNKYLYQIIE